MGIFPNAQGQVTHKYLVVLPNFEPIQDIMGFLVACKNIEDAIKKEEWSQHYSLIFRRSRAANAKVNDGILAKFKHIRAFMVGLVTCRNEEDTSKTEGARVVTTFFPL